MVVGRITPPIKRSVMEFAGGAGRHEAQLAAFLRRSAEEVWTNVHVKIWKEESLRRRGDEGRRHSNRVPGEQLRLSN